MAGKRDFYEILGVSKTASADELKAAYRKQALKWHPDRWVNASDEEKKTAEANFKEASEAYSVLSDPQKRARYDQLGRDGYEASGGYGGFGGQGGFGGFGQGGGFSFDFGDFGDLGDILGDLFGGGSRRSGGARRGGDIQVTLTLTLDEIARGVEKEITVQRERPCSECGGKGTKNASDVKTCPTCNGSGKVLRPGMFGMSFASACPQCKGTGKVIANPCHKCGGRGIELRRETVRVRIPAGAESGQPLQMRGEGNYGGPGTTNGDLYIIIQEAPNPNIIRQGQDLFTSKTISVMDAMLGAEVTVDGIGGSYKIKIEPGTQSGTTMCLRGKGLPSPRGGFGSTSGNLYVKIIVWVPRNLSRSEKDMFQALRSNSSFTPDPNRDDLAVFEKLKKVY